VIPDGGTEDGCAAAGDSKLSPGTLTADVIPGCVPRPSANPRAGRPSLAADGLRRRLGAGPLACRAPGFSAPSSLPGGTARTGTGARTPGTPAGRIPLATRRVRERTAGRCAAGAVPLPAGSARASSVRSGASSVVPASTWSAVVSWTSAEPATRTGSPTGRGTPARAGVEPFDAEAVEATLDEGGVVDDRPEVTASVGRAVRVVRPRRGAGRPGRGAGSGTPGRGARARTGRGRTPRRRPASVPVPSAAVGPCVPAASSVTTRRTGTGGPVAGRAGVSRRTPPRGAARTVGRGAGAS
jgi:hypothetical protein